MYNIKKQIRYVWDLKSQAHAPNFIFINGKTTRCLSIFFFKERI